jgi:hypothetical protein
VNRLLPVYRVRAVNTAPDSENKMHDDAVAAQYGFRGGLVPGITVYGYMMSPVVEQAPEWLEHGSMKVRFLEPFYDGDPVVVRAETADDGSIRIVAEREDGPVCATGTASLAPSIEPQPPPFPEKPLPFERPVPGRDSVVAGTLLGTVAEQIDTAAPERLLRFSNEILMRNFQLGPWIHAASEVTNWSAARAGEEISACGRIHDRFDRKGHEFVVADVMLLADGSRLVQTVRHTAIYRPARRDYH